MNDFKNQVEVLGALILAGGGNGSLERGPTPPILMK